MMDRHGQKANERPGLIPPGGARSDRHDGPARSDPLSSENWYGRAEQELLRIAAAVRQERDFSLDELSIIATGIVSSIRASDRLVVQALSSPAGDPLITNLVNVGILATKVGMGLAYYGAELERLALAGLTHDIGIFAVPPSLVTKSGRLTQEERALIERHPELGFRLMKKLDREYDWLAQLVLQAHERLTGQGYPNKLKGRQISEMAQIIGVVDVFDALVSPRPYRRRLLPHEAIRELLVTERTSFPREIVKALVEQLSVYPLGTVVRLNTGETGVVVRINPRYPMRPVVRVNEKQGPGGSAYSDEIDLSIAPLVSIVETLDPPAVDRVSFASGPFASPPSSLKTGSASEQFSVLLESLDAIASAIQTVVETKARNGADVEASSVQIDQAISRTPVSDTADALFHNEVLGLFALEAREWLSQIQGALKKLQGEPSLHLRAKLADVILHGITNLGKSAATVRLPDIERMAFSLVPILQSVGGQEVVATSEQFASLQEGIDGITAAVRDLTVGSHSVGNIAATVCQTPAVTDLGRAEPVHPEMPKQEPSQADVESRSVTGSAPILDVLRHWRHAKTRSVEPTREVLDTVIRLAEQEIVCGTGAVDARVIERILQELEGMDEQFLGEVQKRVPIIMRAVSALRRSSDETTISSESLEPIIAEVECLHEAARKVNASAIMLFLQGLRTFLTVASYRKVALALQRLEAVEARLDALIPMAQQWVDVGRIERASIGEILPT